jgi:hypothetical protein
MTKRATISAMSLAVFWSVIHMAHFDTKDDFFKLAALVIPIFFVIMCIYYFFLLWMPCLIVAFITSHKQRQTFGWLILSLFLFVPCLYLAIKYPLLLALYR